MVSFIEPIYKTKDSIQFGWKPETGAYSYNIYVGLGPAASLMATPIVTGVQNVPDNVPATRGKVTCTVNASDVQTFLSLPTTVDFSNHLFYFAITYLDALGAESALADSVIVSVPPVGITVKTMRDDPTINRHGYVFSDDIQRWTKVMGSAAGATIVDSADFYKSNLTTEYVWDGTNMSTMKSYPSDATLAGMPAKLTTYTYSGSSLIKTQVTDSTV